MQRRTNQLHGRGGNKLRHTRGTHVRAHALAHVCFEAGRQQRRQVEGGEDGEAVAHGEEGEGGKGHGPR